MFEPPSPESPQIPVRHYAGVLISVDPARLTEVRQTLDATPGIAVHHLDPATGRCVAVLESADRAEGERLFDAVGRLPHVRSIELVYHLVDREAAGAAEASHASGTAHAAHAAHAADTADTAEPAADTGIVFTEPKP